MTEEVVKKKEEDAKEYEVGDEGRREGERRIHTNDSR